MTTTATNLSIVSAVVHPKTDAHGAEQITLVLRGNLAAAVEPLGLAASGNRPKNDVTSQYVPTGYVGGTVVLTTEDADDSFVSLVG